MLMFAVRDRLRSDDGMTLMEMVVAMTITTIVSTMCLVFFLTTENTGYKSVLTNQDVADARTALSNWTSYLRVAGWLDPSTKTDRFEEITPTKIVFYANLNNLSTADQTTGRPTKVALLLRVTNSTLREGQLVQIIFASDNTTPASVRQLAFDITPTGGATEPIFQPYSETGGAIDPTHTLGCMANGTARAGLCLQTPPSGAGMLDPTVATKSLAVSSGSLRGNPNVNVDATLQTIGGINVVFTATDPSHTVQADFSGSASVNSGFTT
jgi:prepilin-type N-terminal cleavage/methylation domain-containing protein